MGALHHRDRRALLDGAGLRLKEEQKHCLGAAVRLAALSRAARHLARAVLALPGILRRWRKVGCDKCLLVGHIGGIGLAEEDHFTKLGRCSAETHNALSIALKSNAANNGRLLNQPLAATWSTHGF